MVNINATLITNRILTDKSPDPWIIVPMPVVVQAGFVVVVLALESGRVGQADLLCEFRALFGCLAPRFVLS